PAQAGLFTHSRGAGCVSKVVLIVVGSESDKPKIEPAFKILEQAQVGYEFHVSSAHRQPEATGALFKDARAKGFRVVIAGAGLSAALPGFASAESGLPESGLAI